MRHDLNNSFVEAARRGMGDMQTEKMKEWLKIEKTAENREIPLSRDNLMGPREHCSITELRPYNAYNASRSWNPPYGGFTI